MERRLEEADPIIDVKVISHGEDNVAFEWSVIDVTSNVVSF